MIKRIFDISASVIALMLLSPLLGITAFVIYLKSGSPIFFRQIRIGLNGKPFELIKFRTMSNEMELSGLPLSDSQRLHSLGAFLRQTSIDELPELWNVIKGDMSLVGPRPLLVEYIDYYHPEELARHNVRPGITGLAQISGRNYLGWDDQLKMDVFYANQRSFLFDISILLKTVKKVFLRQDVMTVPEELRLSLSKEREHLKKDEASRK